MDFTQLRCFLEVCRTKNISAAAKQLGVSQPTLSRYIKALETELGFAVFERNTKSLQLTPEGQYLSGAFEGIVKQTEAAVEQARNLQRKQLRVGVLRPLHHTVIRDFFERIRIRYPGVELEIRRLDERELVAAFNRGTIDAAVCIREILLPWKQPHTVPLPDQPLVIFCSDESMMAHYGLDWLKGNVGTLVCLDERDAPGLLDFHMRVCQRIGISIFDVVRTDDVIGDILYAHEKTGFTFFSAASPAMELSHAWSFPLDETLCYHLEAYFHTEVSL